MIYPLVQELADDRIAVAVTCRVLGFTKQGFYAWRKRGVSSRDWLNAHLVTLIRQIHAEDPELGAERVWEDLTLDRGVTVGLNRVEKLMRENQIRSVIVRKTGSGKRAGPAVHDDLVGRVFVAAAPNQLWLTDITEHPTGEGKLYMAAILDVCSKRIVGYAMGKRMTAALPSKALSRAVRDRKPVGTIVHSDRGSQFRSNLFTGLLAVHGLRGSMGRVGAAGDNAAMESFFALLQKNVLNRRRWETRAEVEAAIFRWIEIKYHRKWRKKALGRRTPLEFEKWHAEQAA